MLNEIKPPGVYSPDIVVIMSAAFDRVCQTLPEAIRERAEIRRKLAWIIIGYVDRGERDAARLAKRASQALAKLDRDNQSIN